MTIFLRTQMTSKLIGWRLLLPYCKHLMYKCQYIHVRVLVPCCQKCIWIYTNYLTPNNSDNNLVLAKIYSHVLLFKKKPSLLINIVIDSSLTNQLARAMYLSAPNLFRKSLLQLNFLGVYLLHVCLKNIFSQGYWNVISKSRTTS